MATVVAKWWLNGRTHSLKQPSNWPSGVWKWQTNPQNRVSRYIRTGWGRSSQTVSHSQRSCSVAHLEISWKTKYPRNPRCRVHFWWIPYSAIGPIWARRRRNWDRQEEVLQPLLQWPQLPCYHRYPCFLTRPAMWAAISSPWASSSSSNNSSSSSNSTQQLQQRPQQQQLPCSNIHMSVRVPVPFTIHTPSCSPARGSPVDSATTKDVIHRHRSRPIPTPSNCRHYTTSTDLQLWADYNYRNLEASAHHRPLHRPPLWIIPITLMNLKESDSSTSPPALRIAHHWRTTLREVPSRSRRWSTIMPIPAKGSALPSPAPSCWSSSENSRTTPTYPAYVASKSPIDCAFPRSRWRSGSRIAESSRRRAAPKVPPSICPPTPMEVPKHLQCLPKSKSTNWRLRRRINHLLNHKNNVIVQ